MIAIGTVGWDDVSPSAGDQDDDEATGVSLVRVTLYQDHNVITFLRDGKAFGKQILAQVLGPTALVYQNGMRVVVAIPDGLEHSTGAAVLLGVLGHPPTDFIALAQKVFDELDAQRTALNKHIAAFNMHIHPVSGANTTAPTANVNPLIPVANAPAINSVAAEESKAR